MKKPSVQVGGQYSVRIKWRNQ